MTAEQLTNEILMIEPRYFGYNPDAAGTNSYMEAGIGTEAHHVSERALAEFDNFVTKLTEAGVKVVRVKDTETPHTPDAVFPNNWFSTHPDEGGTVVLYPMLPENRRLERRPDIIESLHKDHGYQIKSVIDLSPSEKNGEILEGTGSMVLDRVHKVVYASKSPRTTELALEDFAKRMGFRTVLFETRNQLGINDQIYHTNVIMSVGESFAVVCLDAVTENKDGLIASLMETGHEIITIDNAQMNAFAGNMLEVKDAEGNPLIVMSESAHQSLTGEQIDKLSKHGKILNVPLGTIEKHGGGSARCMMAELFLPKNQAYGKTV